MSNEIKQFEDIMEAWDLDSKIGNNRTKWWKGAKLKGDALLRSWEQFICKNIAVNKCGMKWPDVEDWGPKECRKFYNERLLKGSRILPKEYQLSNASNTALKTLFETWCEEDESVMNYRWDNGYAFKSFRDRVYFALDKVVENLGEQAGGIIKKMQKAEAAMTAVAEEFDDMISTVPMSPRAKNLIKYMRQNLRIADFLPEDLDYPEDFGQ